MSLTPFRLRRFERATIFNPHPLRARDTFYATRRDHRTKRGSLTRGETDKLDESMPRSDDVPMTPVPHFPEMRM